MTIEQLYKELATQLGDLHFKKTLLEKQIQQIQEKIEALNEVSPHLKESSNE